MKITDNFVMFWGGDLSQWAKVNFEDNDGIKYSSTEQFMMANKALLFDDKEMFEKIMKINNVKVIKQYGREVKNFDKEIWNNIAKDIVYVGNYYKFTQNEEFEHKLISFGKREFVEASPKDKIWGIGLHESDSKALNKSTWEGLNWLGECLTEVRDDILSNDLSRFNSKSSNLELMLNKILELDNNQINDI